MIICPLLGPSMSREPVQHGLNAAVRRVDHHRAFTDSFALPSQLTPHEINVRASDRSLALAVALALVLARPFYSLSGASGLGWVRMAVPPRAMCDPNTAHVVSPGIGSL